MSVSARLAVAAIAVLQRSACSIVGIRKQVNRINDVALTSVLYEQVEDAASLILGFDADHAGILEKERLRVVLGKILAEGAKSVEPLQ